MIQMGASSNESNGHRHGHNQRHPHHNLMPIHAGTPPSSFELRTPSLTSISSGFYDPNSVPLPLDTTDHYHHSSNNADDDDEGGGISICSDLASFGVFDDQPAL
jgi:hypothetical protein